MISNIRYPGVISICAALVIWACYTLDIRRVSAATAEEVKYLNPAGLEAPVARFSHAVVVPSGEGLIFVSGQTGEDAKGNPVSSDVVAQTRQAMENIKKALTAAGSDFSHVVKMNIYLTDMDHMPELRKVRDAYLDPKRAPAMTTAKVLQLVGTNSKVEIEVTAVKSR